MPLRVSKVKIIAALVLLLVFAIAGFFLRDRVTPQAPRQDASLKTSFLCTEPPKTTAIGSVEYPIQDDFAHLRGLGMVLTAEECGAARLEELKKTWDFLLVGGRIHLKENPTRALLDTLLPLGFICEGADSASSCKIWKLTNDIPLESLLKLKPHVSEILREECARCG